MGWRWWVQVAVRVGSRPSLWPTALVQTGRLAGRGWWRRRPFLPVPEPDYLRFRMETAYGGRLDAAHADDVVTYLAWCRQMARL